MLNTITDIMFVIVIFYLLGLIFIGGTQLLIFVFKLFTINSKSQAFKQHMWNYSKMVLAYGSLAILHQLIATFLPEAFDIYWESGLVSGVNLIYFTVVPLPIAYFFFKNIMTK